MMDLKTIRQHVQQHRDAVAVPLGLWSGLLVIDLFFGSRWLAGELRNPISATLAWLSSAVIICTALTALVLWRRVAGTEKLVTKWLPEAITLLIPLCWMCIVSLGVTPYVWGGLCAIWGYVLIAVGLIEQWVPYIESGSGIAGFLTEPMPPEELENPATHWQKRQTTPEGEMIEGGARVEFMPGQKEVLLHLAFCPPLAFVPEIHTEDTSDGKLELKTEAVHTFGARLSVRRRSDWNTSESCEITYVAVPMTSEAAA